MSATRLASRYAKALLDLSVEKMQLEEVHSDMEVFQKALANKDFGLMVKSPIINSDKKKAILKRIFGNKFNPITNKFMDIIIRKKREFYLPEIANEFETQYRERKQITTATLVTASAIDNSVLEQMKQIVRRDTGKANVVLEASVDASLIGGFILKFSDKLYDSSISHKLEKLSKQFDENKYVRAF
ncbi:MAG: ATP synthase F1 subunit delta [Chitinophagales bacterium]